MDIDVILKIISKLLRDLANKIDAGYSNLNETEAVELVSIIKRYTDKEEILSKYEACKFLGVSRATFDNHIRAGKLPKGSKRAGFKELFWKRKDLESAVKAIKSISN